MIKFHTFMLIYFQFFLIGEVLPILQRYFVVYISMSC